MNKNVPYAKVALSALTQWNGLSQEEAEEKISNSDVESLDSEVYAGSSIDSGLKGISDFLALSEQESAEFREATYGRGDSKIFESIEAKSKQKEPNEMILNALFHIHDDWVVGNEKKFNSREKKHQHMPSELIGFSEVKSDLIFLKPILESAGINIDEVSLQKAYHDRVQKFFIEKEIKSDEDLAETISQGADFYSPLEGQDSITDLLSDKDFVMETVIPQIKEKGIGKDGDLLSKLMEGKITPEQVENATLGVTKSEMEDILKELAQQDKSSKTHDYPEEK